MADTQKVLCPDGVWRTFTRRGNQAFGARGFVRVNGHTIVGWQQMNTDSLYHFVPEQGRQNADLMTAAA